jgi:hypothetical protein
VFFVAARGAEASPETYALPAASTSFSGTAKTTSVFVAQEIFRFFTFVLLHFAFFYFY